jgi:peptidoglycan/xylan/chitin deacetylase (PgdA/CDA1 family)
MTTVYLTFDDGPLGGTDDVIKVLNAKETKGTLFMVGAHVSTDWRKQRLTDAHASKYVEVANHSTTHADNEYREYYKDPKAVLAGFDKSTKTLKITKKPVPARLPGRNTWRLTGITRTASDSGAAADLLHKNGYRLYGWDVEWRMDGGVSVESADEMISKIDHHVKAGKLAKAGKVILLTHDVMFRESKGGKIKLERLIDKLKASGYSMDFVTNY